MTRRIDRRHHIGRNSDRYGQILRFDTTWDCSNFTKVISRADPDIAMTLTDITIRSIAMANTDILITIKRSFVTL